jgi:hypothetical protein
MSDRWKFQLVFGSLWALLVSVVLIIIDLKDKGLAEQFSGPGVYIRTAITFLIGIFGFAYYMWKQQLRRREKAGNLPDNNAVGK